MLSLHRTAAIFISPQCGMNKGIFFILTDLRIWQIMYFDADIREAALDVTYGINSIFLHDKFFKIPFHCFIPSGGSAILQAQAMAQKETVCLPLCLVPLVSVPPLSLLLRWTPRPSSKLCSSPLYNPPPPLSPRAHRPLPFASKYSSCLV